MWPGSIPMDWRASFIPLCPLTLGSGWELSMWGLFSCLLLRTVVPFIRLCCRHSGRDLCSQGRAVCKFFLCPSEWFYCFPGSLSQSPGGDDVNGAVPDTQGAFNGPIKQPEDSSSCGLKAFPEDFLLGWEVRARARDSCFFLLVFFSGMVVCNWVVILSVCITVLCVFDPTGRTFVKLRATKRRQRNLRTYNLR